MVAENVAAILLGMLAASPDPAGSPEEKPKADPDPAAARARRRRWATFALALILALGLFVNRCWQNPPPAPPWDADTLGHGSSLGPRSPPPRPPQQETIPERAEPGEAKPEPVPDSAPVKIPEPIPRPADTVQAPSAADTTRPFLFADPWGGRHFDSVTVKVICRESCLVLYSLNDSLHFRSYETPLTFRRHTSLWITGVKDDGSWVEPVRIDYAIERDPGHCPAGMVPFASGGKAACMDVYEWPNREDEAPRALVSLREAETGCAQAGKRLCSLEEWREVCAGPEGARYPYAARYDARYCASQESGPARSGHFPACRSYYGTYDMTGNLWEWTSTPYPEREGFSWVAGGNWDAGDQATCGFSRYSFYPQNRFSMVGFRCCRDAATP